MTDPSPSEWRPFPGSQTSFLTTRATEALYGGSAGCGKALPVDTPIPTPDGWTEQGELRVGDLVLDERGRSVRVLVAHPVCVPKKAFRLLFDDGTEQVASGEHLWLTLNARELLALTRHSDAWRAERRGKRPERRGARGWRSEAARDVLVRRNRAQPPKTVAAPRGLLRTTEEIAETLRTAAGRANHAIHVAAPLDLGPAVFLPLSPYVLGVWLGDGNSADAHITSADVEVVEQIRVEGWAVERRKSAKYRWCVGERKMLPRVNGRVGWVNTFALELRCLGVLGNKHVPLVYLRASREQRLALLQGLMDTDGTAEKSGAVAFCSTNERLASGVHELVLSLGYKARKTEGRAKLRGKDCGPRWVIKWTAREPVFRLLRKLERVRFAVRRTTEFRYVVRCEPVDPVPMRCITVDGVSGMYLAGRSMVPTHNSQALLVGAARYYKRRGYRALLLRRTTKETKRTIADLAHQFYPALGMLYEHGVWSYPNGGTIIFDGINREQDIYKYNSTAWCYIGFDELSTFSEAQYLYMLSRLRGPTSIPWFVRSGTNPVGPHVEWVRKRWRYWIYRPHQRTDEFAGPYAHEGQVLWFAASGPGGEDRHVRVGTKGAVSRVYFPGLLADNPILSNSNYADILNQLDPVTRAQLRDGDWMMRAEPGTFFRRDWFRKRPPLAGGVVERVRFWDRAATEADEKKKNNPDFTVGLLMALTVDGKFVVEDVRRARLEPGEVFNFIVTTAEDDELLVPKPMQRFEQEPGSSGKADVALYKRALAGMDVSSIRPTGDKVARARPVAAQAASPASNVWIVQDDWNADFLEEYEAFPNKDMHDDQVDAGSGALAYLAPMARERRKREVNEERATAEQRTFGPAYDVPYADAADVERSYRAGITVGRGQRVRGGMDSPTRSGGF